MGSPKAPAAQDCPAAESDTSGARHRDELKELAGRAGRAAVQRAVSVASTATLAAVVTGASDPHAVLMLLARDVPPAPTARLIAEAKARMGSAAFRARVGQQAGGMLNRREVAALLGVSPATVSAMQRRSEILGVPLGAATGFAAAQFANGEPVAGLKQILSALDDMQPWAMLQALVVPLSGFTAAPTSMLELLRNGVSDDELAALSGLARSWAS